VFDNQPTFGDNPTARNGEPSPHQGDWWIGGYENRSSEAAEEGAIQGDEPKGTLTSPRFLITAGKISFLIIGGCNMTVVRPELLVDNEVRSLLIVCSSFWTSLRTFAPIATAHRYCARKFPCHFMH